MTRLSQHLSDVQFNDPLVSDPGERIAAASDALGTGEPCRLIIRGAEAPIDIGQFSAPVPVGDYTIRVRKSDLASLAETQLLRNTDTGDIYRIDQPPLPYGRDRDQWIAQCKLEGGTP